MHIGLYSDSFPPLVDGVSRTVENYAQILNDQGKESYVVAPNCKGYLDEWDYKVIRYPTMPMILTHEYRLAMPAAALHVQRQLENVHTDIAHAHSPFFCGQAAKFIANRQEVPLVGTFHSKYKDDFRVRLKMNLPGQMVAKYVASFFSRCDYVWAVSSGTARTLQEYGYEGPVTIMPNGSDIERSYKAPDSKQKVCQKYGLDPDVPLLLFVGRLTRTKNTLLLIDGLSAVARAGCAFNLLFVGTGEDEDIMRQAIVRQNLDDRTCFAGKVMDREALKSIYLAGDLFVFPSVYDNAPLVVREAAACGCPSLLIRGSNSAEGAVNEVNAYLCEESREDFALTVYKALSNPERLSMIGEQARRSIYMSWEDAVALAKKEYDTILGKWVPKKHRIKQRRAYT